MTDPADNHPIERVLNTGEAAVGMVRRFFAGYFWLILKNVIGWTLMLLSLPVGVVLPGPGGLPMFLLGFALVAFPGKRKLTSHFLRGRPLRIEASIFVTLTTVASLVVIAALLWFIGERYQQLIAYFELDPKSSTPGFVAAVIGVCLIAAVVTLGMMRLGLLFANKLIRIIPRIRRLIRPYLRKWGIVLLPPPPKRQKGLISPRAGMEILELSARSRERFGRWWIFLKPWLRRLTMFGITAVLLYFVIEPIVRGWRQAEVYVNLVRPIEFVCAVAMAAVFLFVFRVTGWWALLAAMGHRLHGATATRIWMTSELSRYLPGRSWQVASRSFLARAYGVPSATCVSSHVLEIVLFFLANAMFAVLCLLLLGMSRVENESTRGWLIAGASVLPLLLILLHPRVFYSITNRILLAMGKPKLQTQVRGGTLVVLLLWKLAGLAFMSLAIWLIASEPFNLPLSKWWLVGGIYSIAWLAGFVSFWAPGGIGVREAVFMSLLLLALPNYVKNPFDPNALQAVAAMLALILRVWIVAAEMVVAIFGYTFDLDGALAVFRGRRPNP